MAEKFFPYDPADALGSTEAIEVFLIDAFETGDSEHIAAAFSDVTRAKGMEGLAEKIGLSHEQLHQTLCANSTLTLKTTLAVLNAVGLALAVVPAPAGSTDALSPMRDDGADLGLDVRNT